MPLKEILTFKIIVTEVFNNQAMTDLLPIRQRNEKLK